jgi:hypothetical protein
MDLLFSKLANKVHFIEFAIVYSKQSHIMLKLQKSYVEIKESTLSNFFIINIHYIVVIYFHKLCCADGLL